MPLSDIAKKLRLQDCKRALIMNAPEGYRQILGEPPEGVVIDSEPSGTVDFAQLFVQNREQLDLAIDRVLEVIEFDSLLWISYPKGRSGVTTDLNRDRLSEILADRGIRPVAQISIDSVWSAMRFRPQTAVGT
jgi:hypothetical protein